MADSIREQPYLPGNRSTFNSGGMRPKEPSPELGMSIGIIGTSEGGPLYEYVDVSRMTLEEVEQMFGSRNDPDSLTHAYLVCMNASPGLKDISLCRYGPAEKATLNLAEAVTTGSGVYGYSAEDSTQITDAVTIEAVYPGTKGNTITVGTQYSSDDGKLYVVFYNPYNGKSYKYPTNLGSKQNNFNGGFISTASDFVNTINNPYGKLNSFIKATLNTMETQVFAIDCLDPEYAIGEDPSSSGITVTDSYAEINLSTYFAANADESGWFTDSAFVHEVNGDDYVHIPLTAGNRIVDITDITITNGALEMIKSAGSLTVLLDHNVSLGADGYPMALKNLDGSDDPGDEIKLSYRNSFVAVGDDSTTSFTLSTYLEIDEAAVDSNGDLIFKITISDPNGNEYTLPDGCWTVGAFTGTPTFTTVIEIYGDTYNTPVKDGYAIRIDYDSVPTTLTQYFSKTAVSATEDWKSYHISGNVITFGAPVPGNATIRYLSDTTYELDGNIIIFDSFTGKLRFIDPTSKPDLSKLTSISMKLEYEPEWVDIASTKALSGGTNGTSMDNNDRKVELKKTLEKLENAHRDIICFADEIYLDSVIKGYDPETGLRHDINAGFHTVINDYIYKESPKNVGSTIGIISLAPVVPYKDGTKFTQSDIDLWCERATIVDDTDPLRAANVMAAFTDGPFMLVSAIAPVYQNLEITTIPYPWHSGPALAGVIAKLGYTGSLLNSRIMNMKSNRHDLSHSQISDLTNTRYIAPRKRLDGVWVISDDPTCEGPTGDYYSLATVRTVQGIEMDLRRVLEPFIGAPLNDSTINAANAKVKNILGEWMTNQRLYAGSIIQVSATDYDRQRNRLRVNARLRVTTEVKYIYIEFTLLP